MQACAAIVAAIFFGLCFDANAQLQWVAYDDNGNLVTNNAGTGGDATYGGSVSFTVPAGKEYVFATESFVPLQLTNASAAQKVNFFMSANGGLYPAGTGRILGMGLLSDPGTRSSALDDQGYWVDFNTGNPDFELFYRPNTLTTFFQYNSTYKLGSGATKTGNPTNNITYGMQFQLNMNSTANAVSIGTGTGSFSAAGAAMTNGAVNELADSSALALTTLDVTNFNEFCFMFNNSASTNITVTLSGITLVPANPVITTQPVNTGGSPGGGFSFAVALNSAAGTPLAYQWYQIIGSTTNALTDGTTGDGSSILGSATATLTIANAQVADSSAFFVVISNAYGVATSSVATLFVSATPTVPVINFVSPTNATVIAGNSTNIFVNTFAAPTPTVYWYDNNSNLLQSGAGTTLSLTDLQLANAGTYTVVSSNSAGSVLTNFTVNVIETPVISSAPTNLLLNVGNAANFSVTASGVPAPTYQWYKNNVPIPGATGTNYSIASVVLTNIGTYSVVVSNAAGAVSASAYLAIYSSMTGTPAAPANGAANVCVDTLLSITFSQTPTAGTTGKINIYDASNPGTPVDTLDMSGGNLQPRTIGGISINAYNILINGNTAVIYPHAGVLTTGNTYYVTMDPGVIVDPNGAYFTGISASTTWQFTTKSTGPANPVDLVVAGDGSGDFCTVQGAIDSVPGNNTTPTTINIRNGVYTEIDRVNSKNNMTFIGQGRHQTIITYANNDVINASTTTRPMFGVNQANDIAVENLTLTNSTPLGGSQAEALLVNLAKQFMLLDCDLDSYQDTLLVNQSGDQAYIQDSYIQGNTDYIWGSGTLYATNTILMYLTSGSHLTQARTAQYTNGFAFVNCRILGITNGTSNCDLGRDAGSSGNTPNYPYGQVAYINCTMDTNVVIPAGWILGSGSTQGPDTANLRFWEYESVNTNGALVQTGARVPWAVELDGATATNEVQNVTNWLYGWQPQLAPQIFNQPTNVTVALGGTAVFAVNADGISSPVYQWLQNGTNAPYPSANSSTLIVPNAMANASYSVIVSNAAGVATSSAAELTVTIPPPARVSGAVALAGGAFQFTISGTQGQGYRVWATTNLLLSPVTTTWTEITSGVFGATPVVFTDPGTGAAPQRFYVITEP
ncbi:MAG TPA: pectinesterase family protein [Alphaproteobacteria bacterium]|nr:pectinesterase family protein [Alphaproteobacteria bacterium]